MSRKKEKDIPQHRPSSVIGYLLVPLFKSSPGAACVDPSNANDHEAAVAGGYAPSSLFNSVVVQIIQIHQ
jgi:hypothetical protein